MDIIIALIIGGFFSLGLIANYQPKLNKMKKSQAKMYSDFREYFKDLSPEEQESFFSSLGDSEKASFQDFLVDSFHHDFQQQMFDQQINEFNNWAMSESLKSVTPFDHGGYVMGAGFNPSDTMAYEAHQMDMNSSFNDFNNSSFNDTFFNDNSFNDNNFNNF